MRNAMFLLICLAAPASRLGMRNTGGCPHTANTESNGHALFDGASPEPGLLFG